MGMFDKVKIGFVLTPNFRVADVIGSDAVFRFHPRNIIYYIAEKEGVVYGKGNLGVEANSCFDNCPDLDVLVIGESSEQAVGNYRLLQFLSYQAKKAKYVIGISNGVQILYNAGVLTHQKVTADRSTLELLKQSKLHLINERKCIVDGKFVTAGPSSGAIEAAFTVFNKLRGNWLTKFVELNLEYDAHVQHATDKNTILKQPPLPRPLKIGVFAAPDLYIPDVIGACDVFGSIPNTKIYYLGYEKGISKSVIGFGPKIMTGITLDECPPLDVLIFGATHPRYISDSKLLDFILQQERNASAIISICAGTFIVGSTGLLEGKQAATNYHQVADLPRIGVCPTGKEVAVDRKYFSAGPAVGSYEVGLKAVEKIVGEEWAKYIEHEVLEFAPNPVFGTTPKNASTSILNTTHAASFVLKRVFRPFIKAGYYGQSIKNKSLSPL